MKFLFFKKKKNKITIPEFNFQTISFPEKKNVININEMN